jgi:hypothetical protein
VCGRIVIGGWLDLQVELIKGGGQKKIPAAENCWCRRKTETAKEREIYSEMSVCVSFY